MSNHTVDEFGNIVPIEVYCEMCGELADTHIDDETGEERPYCYKCGGFVEIPDESEVSNE